MHVILYNQVVSCWILFKHTRFTAQTVVMMNLRGTKQKKLEKHMFGKLCTKLTLTFTSI